MVNEENYRRKSLQLMQSILKKINLEIMLQYLKPDERKALYCLLNEDVDSYDSSNYSNISEYAYYYDTSLKDKASAINTSSITERFAKLKILNYEFISSFPSGIYLDFKDIFQQRIFMFTKIIYSKLYSDFLTLDFSGLKDYYFSYEKEMTDKFFNKLDPHNSYFSLILLQGLMTELKDNIITIPSANISLINTVFLGKIYNIIIKLYEDKQAFLMERISDEFAAYVVHTVSDIEDKKNKIIEKFRDEGIIYREKLNAYEDKIKQLTRINNDSLIHKLYDELKNKELENSQLKDILLTKADEEEKKIEALNIKIYNISLEKERLLSRITKLEIENSRLKTKLFEIKKDNLLSPISELKEHIDKHADKLYDLIGANNEQHNQVNRIEPSDPEAEPQTSYRLGYITLTKSAIELVTPFGRYPVNNIPDQSMIAEGQFVRIDGNCNFVNSYNYYSPYDIQFHLHPECKFGIIQNLNGSNYIDFGNRLVPAANKNDITLPKGQLVLADSSGYIKILFKKLHFNLDYFYNINKFRKIELWRVKSVLDDKCIIENIDNNHYEIINKPENYTIKNNDILLRKGNDIINVFNFRFYSHSQYYSKAVCGVAEVKDDTILLVKANGEKIIVNVSVKNCGIENGDLITIDEFNNLIKYDKATSSTSSNAELTISKSRIVRSSDKYKVKHIVIKKRVLIIGNPTYQQSYKLNFLKHGYQAELVDGYLSWTRVKKSIKNVDCIVVIVNYVSHDNMWQIKDNIKDIPVIYSDTDGANRILELIEGCCQEEEAKQLDMVL